MDIIIGNPIVNINLFTGICPILSVFTVCSIESENLRLIIFIKKASSNQLDLRSFATRCFSIISTFFIFVKGSF